MSIRLGFLVCLALAPLATAPAQQVPSLQAGDRIRIEAGLLRGDFDVVAWTDSNRRLRDVGRRTDIAVGLDSIQRLDVRRGQESRARSAGRRGLIGLLAAGTVGAVLGFMSGDDPDEALFAFSAEAKAALLGGMMGTVGLTIGAVSGLISPSTRWERVIPAPRVSVVRAPGGGIGVGVQKSF
jgi:hypothetical protein